MRAIDGHQRMLLPLSTANSQRPFSSDDTAGFISLELRLLIVIKNLSSQLSIIVGIMLLHIFRFAFSFRFFLANSIGLLYHSKNSTAQRLTKSIKNACGTILLALSLLISSKLATAAGTFSSSTPFICMMLGFCVDCCLLPLLVLFEV